MDLHNNNEMQEDTPWAILLADNLDICDAARGMIEDKLENWRSCFENPGLKVCPGTMVYQVGRCGVEVAKAQYSQHRCTDARSDDKLSDQRI